jgi:hypothetical protein
MSSFIMGNYRFQVGTADPDFLNHRNIFLLLIIIQGVDIFLTFFKILKIDVIRVD